MIEVYLPTASVTSARAEILLDINRLGLLADEDGCIRQNGLVVEVRFTERGGLQRLALNASPATWREVRPLLKPEQRETGAQRLARKMNREQYEKGNRHAAGR